MRVIIVYVSDYFRGGVICMYYDNKSTFYIKQYGPAVLILVIAVVLIGSGIYIYVSNSGTKTPNQEVIVASDKLENEEKLEEPKVEQAEEKKEEILTSLPEEYSNLKSLEKTTEFKVEKVLDNKKVRVVIPNTNKKFDITLIGINFNNSISEIVTKMQEDLKDKNVKLAFDTVKVDNSQIYAYIYINNELYNAKILENGYATFQEEPKNKSLNTDLKQSQTFAKQQSVGIWAE